ncbi:MAG TPA: tripartite tricarboxylate transporter substrate binding protein [Burkholderiales bacterium]
MNHHLPGRAPKAALRAAALLITALPAVLCAPLLAQAAWPDHPIRMVVPYPAGGNADVTARLVAQQVGTTLGQQIVVDNKPGAGGAIGEDLVAKAAGDGYTVLYDASAFTVNPAMRKLPFDPLRDLIPVSQATISPQILVVGVDSPWKSLADLTRAVHAEPGKFTFASAGNGTASHLAGETLNRQAKIKLTHVPYKGGAPALADLMGGQVTMYFGTTASTAGYVLAGKLKALAVTSLERVPNLPAVPTFAESGLAGYNVVEWTAVFLPRGTPPEIVTKLGAAVQAAVKEPTTNARLLKLGVIPLGSSPQVFSKYLHEEMARVGTLAKALDLKVE